MRTDNPGHTWWKAPYMTDAPGALSPLDEAGINAAVEEALRDVIDPELGINVVDLGLLYGVSIEPDGTVVVDIDR